MNIIELAKEAQMRPDAREIWWKVCTHDLERFAALVRAEALEEVAVMFENEIAFMYAAAIRKLK